MEGVERRRLLWKNLKHRLQGLNGMGFCGSSWGRRIAIREEDELEETHEDSTDHADGMPAAEHIPTPTSPCSGQVTAIPGMNLATALAADRQSRNVGPVAREPDGGEPVKSLMRLFEETDGADVRYGAGGAVEDGRVCCVCMERDKGSALIPCGHTYCRVCSRELWLNRGFCPLCNRSIIEILDIF
ncbi:hypothetical protein RJ639_015844 [Escallonia herrerae]|uniref:RING-type domain-containing protein n=1 Tax=Escallonia herrerae TaxID=1293975 RepID=A0AA88VEQ2_9ASTE|nr:hypothetical protein RJ639_015844 [Escallonia herrerae]